MADEEFLKRWSRQKLTKTHEAEPGGGIEDLEIEQAALPEVSNDETASDAEQQPSDLPSIDSLDADSDYTPFLGEDVPEDLAREALRKLWRSDPVFANLDGLNDYDGDYSKLGIAETVVKTAYKIGRGFATDEEHEPENEPKKETMNLVEESTPEEEANRIDGAEDEQVALEPEQPDIPVEET